ncbi:tetratricopeptide repeat protein [Aeromonas encheleia]|jgi:tetratricopeptide (TPR) repeat protein|uniref:tetratricopeptide repeat protein n=1 Tax=Aeromonas TaxID=642 RepID=UPI001C43F113|nr:MULTISPECIES: tetratricopeptide repeat protein [Aeromonas]MBV7599635.1 tetratricopeptide repeat protein [Aeromonas sp. sia0103]UNP88626.1 tetratricopeptide repeat protein [Aeromonas encheleia]
MKVLSILLVGILCFSSSGLALAAGGGGSSGGGGSGSSSTQRQLQRVEQLVGAQQWQQAEALLRDLRQDAANSADVWNWSGYVARKSGRLAQAFPYYDKALRLDPEHRGAHEYLGEAYLQNGEPQKAQEQLRILQGLCGRCEEADDLSAALRAAPQPKKPTSSFLLGG